MGLQVQTHRFCKKLLCFIMHEAPQGGGVSRRPTTVMSLIPRTSDAQALPEPGLCSRAPEGSTIWRRIIQPTLPSALPFLAREARGERRHCVSQALRKKEVGANLWIDWRDCASEAARRTPTPGSVLPLGSPGAWEAADVGWNLQHCLSSAIVSQANTNVNVPQGPNRH